MIKKFGFASSSAFASSNFDSDLEDLPKNELQNERWERRQNQLHRILSYSTQYAHYVFKSFKQAHGGTINFEQFLNILSVLSRGSVVDKLQWIFGLYDINGDGYITKQEMLNIVSAIYDMLGHYTDPAVTEHSAREHVEKIFHQIDSNKDGVVTMDEFMEWCQKDELRTKSLFMLDTIL
ncbi:Kv channel-interacting protein 4 like protein [Argiope bruennichi]|uniref:Kv channel-interacting protein 4 like protein n=1 Tax=Argiope bruennichi TaxID=94029 RepID=A0A8T0FI31_ARGBR|nr:Kv channel-interacting protein 4 like protein [Argiope bruennichi]